MQKYSPVSSPVTLVSVSVLEKVPFWFLAVFCRGFWDMCSHTTGAGPKQVRMKVLEILRTSSGPGGVTTRPQEACGPSSNSSGSSSTQPLGEKASDVRAREHQHLASRLNLGEVTSILSLKNTPPQSNRDWNSWL